ncbi:hypothetical protein DFH08DRAFT_958813 [Mycena albidolilacea]|uniref:Uncharacterized protein n=1 Tax=Mycena albidolilacea TaxID=1033008 RepID=A0AAD7A674_9AGAR|nr:hypothetical protein DFH08DRAFT_958813 [Mycena albidolilacea]
MPKLQFLTTVFPHSTPSSSSPLSDAPPTLCGSICNMPTAHCTSPSMSNLPHSHALGPPYSDVTSLCLDCSTGLELTLCGVVLCCPEHRPRSSTSPGRIARIRSVPGGEVLSRPSTGTRSHPGTAAAANGGNTTTNGGPASAAASIVDGKPTKIEAGISPCARRLAIYTMPSIACLRHDHPRTPPLSCASLTFPSVLFSFVLRQCEDEELVVLELLALDPLCPVPFKDLSNATTDSLFGSGAAGEGGTFFGEVNARGWEGMGTHLSGCASGDFLLHNAA